MARLIYLADDDPALLEVFGTFLEQAGYEVQAFPTGDELVAKFELKEPDLVILDVMMPGTDGLTICKNLRAVSNVPIVILTAKDTEMDYLYGLGQGADDYLTKPFSPAMLVMRVRALLRRVDMGSASNASDNSTLQYGDISLSERDHEAHVGQRGLTLTKTEFSLLQCLLSAQGKAVSRDDLLKRVWGIDAAMETRVTDECVRRLRRKLKEAQSSVSIKAVWGYGYKLEKANA